MLTFFKRSLTFQIETAVLAVGTTIESQGIKMNNSQSKGGFLPWNHPDNIVPYKATLDVAFYHHIVMKPVIVFLTVSTNIANCLVFRRQGLSDRMNLCLFVLSFVDMMYLAYSIVFTVSFWIKLFDPLVGEVVYQEARCYGMGISYGLRETSACVNAVIAVDRCLCVLFPLRAKTILSSRTMGALLVAIAVSMQLAFVTTPVKDYIFPVYDNSTGETWWKLTLRDAWQKNAVLVLYDKIDDTVMLIVLPFLTFIIVSGATLITVVKLRAAMSWREKTSSIKGDAQVQQVALTKMLVLVSCAFIVGKLPMMAVTVARIVDPDFSPSGRQSNAHRVAEMMARYVPYIYSSCNFFIYLSRSLRFRSEFRALCGTNSRSPPVHIAAPSVKIKIQSLDIKLESNKLSL